MSWVSHTDTAGIAVRQRVDAARLASADEIALGIFFLP